MRSLANALGRGNYLQGSAISAANFVSFSYDGSNLLQPYSILPPSLLFVNGSIPFALPGAVDFHVIGANNYFDLSILGRWDTGVLGSADMGGAGTFGTNAPSAVPEPATMLLMGAALAAAGLARRRRQR